MPRFNSINFCHNRPQIKLFLPKIQTFRALGTPPPDSQLNPTAGGTETLLSAHHCRFLATRMFISFVFALGNCLPRPLAHSVVHVILVPIFFYLC